MLHTENILGTLETAICTILKDIPLEHLTELLERVK
jgi:hypothetical protein